MIEKKVNNLKNRGKNIIENIVRESYLRNPEYFNREVLWIIDDVLHKKFDRKLNFEIPITYVIVNPIGFYCNMSCDYCYSKVDNYKYKMWKYRDIVFLHEKLVELYRCVVPIYKNKLIKVTWHGGEPLLKNIKFYKDVLDIQRRIEENNLDVRFDNYVQTNGTLIDDEWLSFFYSNRFKLHVSISYDGLPFLHDKHRKYKDGSPTSSNILRNMKRVKSAGIDVATIMVVTEDHVPYAGDIFEHLINEVGVKGFTLCAAEDISNRKGLISSLSYGRFLVDLFKKWVEYDDLSVYVGEIESVLRKFFGLPSKVCIFSLRGCGLFPAVYDDFGIYYCHGKHLPFYLGSLREDDIKSIIATRKKIIKDIYGRRFNCLDKGCRYFAICSGGCPLSWHGKKGLNIFCESYKMLCSEIENFIRRNFCK